MDRLLMKKLEMVARVQEFQRAHPYTDRNQAAVGRQFEERLAEAQLLFSRENEERRAYGAETQHRQALRNEILATTRAIVRIGQRFASGDARLASRFKPVKSSSNSAFVDQSKSLLALANENQDLLIRGGLLRAQLAAFASRLAEFQKVMAAIVVLRRKLNQTRIALRDAMADLASLVRVLDVYQAARFADDASVLESWSLLRVVGTPTTRGEVGADSDETVATPAPVMPLVPGGGGNAPLPGDGGQNKAA